MFSYPFIIIFSPHFRHTFPVALISYGDIKIDENLQRCVFIFFFLLVGRYQTSTKFASRFCGGFLNDQFSWSSLRLCNINLNVSLWPTLDCLSPCFQQINRQRWALHALCAGKPTAFLRFHTLCTTMPKFCPWHDVIIGTMNEKSDFIWNLVYCEAWIVSQLQMAPFTNMD